MLVFRNNNNNMGVGLLVSAICLIAAAEATTSTMGYQSWSCKSPLVLSSGTNTAAAVSTPVSLGGAGLGAAEQPATTASATKFLYNLAWGPPNYYISTGANGIPSSPIAQNVQGPLIDNYWIKNAMPSFAANTIEWTATISSSAANGFPYGCCGGIGAVTVNEMSCKSCINNNVALPLTLSTVPATVTADPNSAQTSQLVMCGANTRCGLSTYVPGVSTGPQFTQTDAITTGTGVSTLMFPSSSNSVLAAGVYTFTLWAESICGVVQSSPVSLAARCPPSPTVSAVLRAVPGSPGNPTDVLPVNPDGSYNVTVNSQALVDASCSYAYQINKPNWPLTQSTTPTPTTGFNPTRNLYAIQRVYFSVADVTRTSVSTSSVTSNGAWVSAAPLYDQWVSTATFSAAGPHTVVVTVTDGCSASQARIQVNAVCSCVPVVKAMFVPTIWSNAPQALTNPTPNLNNLAVTNPTLLAASGAVTDMVGVPTGLAAFALTASALDYEVNSVSLLYDWNFVYWAPDYSAQFNKGANLANLGSSLAANFLMSANTLWPPQSAANCNPNGDIPLACSQNWWGLSTDRCCFSYKDIITDVGIQARPAKGTYLYKVFQVMTNPTSTIRQLPANSARTKVYNFMRISSGCNSTAPGGFDWIQTNLTQTLDNVNAATTYYALPLYLQVALNQNMAATQTASSQTYQDFDGFPSVNTGTPSANTPNLFRPTTECGAWLKQTNTPLLFTQTQAKMNSTVQCGRNTDLVLCRVTIAQTSINAGAATLSVSSFGSCKGQWQFSLTADDSCLTSTDYFVVNVGCNRAPMVSAGCANTQTWSAISGTPQFEQISLDGRASYDPDNFFDGFYSLPSPQVVDTYPGCIIPAAGPVQIASTCQNGGLGTYGLTYAWALISYFNSQSQLIYSSSSATATACPTTPANIAKSCADSYCTNNAAFTYPTVDPLTRQYVTSTTGVIGTNGFQTSPQGTTTLYDAWQRGLYAVTPQVTSAPNIMPTIDNGGSVMTAQMIFPDFNAACAPTVYPIVLPNLGTQTGITGAQSQVQFFGAFPTDNNNWGYAQQIKHVGNSAFMAGLTNAGLYTARLYAFDGCSVGFSDVTFSLECPTMDFAPGLVGSSFGHLHLW